MVNHSIVAVGVMSLRNIRKKNINVIAATPVMSLRYQLKRVRIKKRTQYSAVTKPGRHFMNFAPSVELLYNR